MKVAFMFKTFANEHHVDFPTRRPAVQLNKFDLWLLIKENTHIGGLYGVKLVFLVFLSALMHVQKGTHFTIIFFFLFWTAIPLQGHREGVGAYPSCI